MMTSYENFEKIFWLSKTLLVQRMTFRVILLVRAAFESSGMTGRLRIWIPVVTGSDCYLLCMQSLITGTTVYNT